MGMNTTQPSQTECEALPLARSEFIAIISGTIDYRGMKVNSLQKPIHSLLRRSVASRFRIELA